MFWIINLWFIQFLSNQIFFIFDLQVTEIWFSNCNATYYWMIKIRILSRRAWAVHRLDGAQIRHKRSLKRRIMKPFLLGFPRGKVLFHFTCNVKIKNTFSLIKFYRLFIRSLTHSFNCSDFSLSSFLLSIYFFRVFYCFLLLFDSSSFLILTFVANFAYLIFFNYDFVHFHDGYMNTNNTQQTRVHYEYKWN